MCLCFNVETSSWWSWVCFFCNSRTKTAVAILTIDRPPISHFHRQVGWTWRQREEETRGRCRPWRLPPAARRLRHSDVRAGEEKGGLLHRDMRAVCSHNASGIPDFSAWNLWHADDSPWSWINTVDCPCQGAMGWPRRAEGRRSKARYRLRGGSDGLGQNNGRERPAGTARSQPYQVFLRRPHELVSFTDRYVFTSVTVGCLVSCGGSISTLPLL